MDSSFPGNGPFHPQEDFAHLVFLERAKQDEKWGGETHDDSHSQRDWRQYIRYQLRADGPFEERMVKVAALAMAAWESSRRKYAR